MNNSDKNENSNKINSLKNNLNISFESDLNDLINYAKWDLSLISSLKSEKTYKKNLLIIDRDWLLNWKKISGYNNMKNQIFHYLLYIQKNKNDKNCEEESKKLSEIWLSIKSKYNINLSNLDKIPQLNNKKYLKNINKRLLINGEEKFDIISSDIYDLFKKYLIKTQIIKVSGLFCKKKLLLPFNYNDKNINNIFINMLFIQNNKNEIGEILFKFSNLKLEIIEKIRKEICNRNISEFINDFKEQGIDIKEYSFNDENGIQYFYQALNKTTPNKYKPINNNNIPKAKIENKIIKRIDDNMDINNIDNILNFDINKLTSEQLEQKIKEVEKETLKLMEMENNLKNEEILLSKENDDKNIINEENDINNEEYNKYNEQIKNLELKINDSENEIKLHQDKEKKLNEEYKKIKNNYENHFSQNELELNEKENFMKLKNNEIMQRENDLNKKRKNLEKKEQELNIEENNNKIKIKELEDLEEEINEKIKILKNEENLENERMNKELEEEMKELENQIKSKESKNKDMPIVNEENEDLNNDYNNIDIESKEIKSQQINNPFSKLNKIDFRKTSHNQFEMHNSNINSHQDDFNSKMARMSLPNFNIKNKLLVPQNSEEIENKKEINKNLISPGLKKINPANLNSIIQCFVNLKEITEGILNLEKNNFFQNNKGCILSESYLNVIKNLFIQEKTDTYSLNDFLNSISKIDKQNIFAKNKLYIDSKNIINFLIEELHKELNTKKTILNKQIDGNKNNFESQNEKDALCKYLEYFTKNNNSIISKNFYGLLKEKKICQKCKTEFYNFKFYSFLNFNLFQVKKFILKKEKNSKDKNKKTLIKLLDCFDYYNNSEYLNGDLGLYCKKCESKNNMTLMKSIYSSHPIIPIIIDRDEDSKINNDKIDFPEKLDLSKYIEFKNSSKQFFLCGVISNFGYSNNFGKFEAFCRVEQDGKWYNFSDEQVSESNWEDIQKNGMQYVLFYHKI